MAEPNIAQQAPCAVELAAGEYWWCACGRSKRQPLCDRSHQGSGFAPVKFTTTEPQKLRLCGCKHSAEKPFCDGSHKKLGSEQML